jgi:hypothetical protein
LPQVFVTVGVIGATAAARHTTVELPSAGTTGTLLISIVYVYVQFVKLPEQSV